MSLPLNEIVDYLGILYPVVGIHFMLLIATSNKHR